jgi:SAM-dependent methyltransferase
MNEASKLRNLLTDEERAWFVGDGIDIGCGPDPILPGVRRFDREHGDANHITQCVTDTFDFVFSLHCLEHMHDPPAALAEWWKLVRPGGRLLFAVPDEDLYEQGVFPNRFNTDHKATFTLSKRQSWSPRSFNVWDLARSLPGGVIECLELQDAGYDRSTLRFGPNPKPSAARQRLAWLYYGIARRLGCRMSAWEAWLDDDGVRDQTREPLVMAQIFSVVRKIDARPAA